ncbi:ankyrin repeat domain-containing protein [Legionella jordanis]|uniref:Knr4/Smi1-like domain-containing protein n=1 Tax=Legionella jordanis TaxID=456 RepID=A0A0W0VED2_9GAMM|nr:ankyrin repeat domain-containing protein [Legionella jordanis]KTD18480.1 hypothetical protein Ljor_2786 [Legionella jordanis]RMX05385.1 hypothetical protein EAW55_01615 [Legionella jordanis]VEH13170.1 transient-receptor-potential calcium channel protein [Legionella jordanis]
MVKKNSLYISKAFLAEINKEHRKPDKIKQYLADGANINYQNENDGYTALMIAVDKDDEPLVTYLLQQGANPLIKNHHQEIASDLALTHSPIYHLLKNHELLFATLQNDIRGVKAALAAGANINFQGPGEYTALMIAAEQDLLEIVELLIISGADISLERSDGWDALCLSKGGLVYKTLEYGKPFTPEQKKKMMEDDDEDEERFEKGRLRALADRKGQPFALNQLKMHPMDGVFKPAPTASQFAELEQHFGHPLPASLKEILTHYNGCFPLLNYYGDDEYSSISFFYGLDENRDSPANIWWSIDSFSKYLGRETLPFAEDRYGGVYYLKWVKGKAQVWLFQYGDQPFDHEDDNYTMPTAYNLISESLDALLESLYAVQD